MSIIITSSGRAGPERPAWRRTAIGRPLVAVLGDGDRHGVGAAVLRHLDGLDVEVILIGCDAEDSALLESWRRRDLVIVVDPIRTDPGCTGRIHRHVMSRPDRGRLLVFAVEAGGADHAAAAARRVVAAIAAEVDDGPAGPA